MSVQSVERAIQILQTIAAAPAGVSETARLVGLPKSTVARLLATLEGADAVERSSDGHSYQVGPTIRTIARSAQADDLVTTARPHLVHLARETGEAAGLSVPRGFDAHYLLQVDSDNAVQVRDWTGANLPMHLVSAGLVMMAAMDAAELDLILASPLEAPTAVAVTDPDAIRGRLDVVRESGYAWVVDELVEGLTSVAAPIFDPDGNLIAAVHAHGPSYRFPGIQSREELATRVMKTARALTSSLH